MPDLLKKEWPTLLLLATPFMVIPFIWGQLPDRIPIHWNIDGAPDRYASKALGLFLVPGLSIVMYLYYFFFPRIDPKRQTEAQQRPLPIYRFIVPLVLTAVFFIGTFKTLGYDLDIVRLATLVVFLFLLVAGNYLGTIRSNYFMGLRTPWTLEDPEVWARTHRATGRLWVATASLGLLLWLLVGPRVFTYAFVGLCLLNAAFPFIYSFYLYLEKRRASA